MARNLIASRLMAAHDDAATHWAGLHGPDPRRPAANDPLRERIATLLDSLRAGAPEGTTPAWHFAPESFQCLIETLAELGLSPFWIERLYWTVDPESVFYSVLRVAA